MCGGYFRRSKPTPPPSLLLASACGMVGFALTDGASDRFDKLPDSVKRTRHENFVWPEDEKSINLASMKSQLLALLSIYLLILSGCATNDADYERPKVDVVGITKSDTDTGAFQFTIQLRIVNPNAETINLKGLYYELSLDGIDVLNGTANNIPPIEGYSNALVSVSSAANLVNSIRFAARLMETTSDKLPYELRAKLGTSSRWMPATTVTERGMISLR